jgi:hypothetical protein
MHIRVVDNLASSVISTIVISNVDGVPASLYDRSCDMTKGTLPILVKNKMVTGWDSYSVILLEIRSTPGPSPPDGGAANVALSFCI